MNENRLSLAQKSFGADLVLHTNENPVEKLKQFTGGTLAQTVFDATGNKKAMESGTDYMRHGGTFVLVGLFRGELAFQHPALHAKETTLMCSRNATREDFTFVMNVLREKKFNTKAYITKRTSYESIVSGFSGWTSPHSQEIKIVTSWND